MAYVSNIDDGNIEYRNAIFIIEESYREKRAEPLIRFYRQNKQLLKDNGIFEE